ncbi:MAG: carbon starvation CstA family protein, partial [Bacillota bacterium]|nr:carbon starvation CstA family protein [Bacillota bacterium]
MATFLIGLVILIGGGLLYGKFCENVFGPDDRETPAYAKQDGVDYVPMQTWKNSLINLLNIAGTGPILGPIQGILFGPIAFLAIPIGNVIGGSMHDYFSGMICTRDGGAQMPEFVKNYTNKAVYVLYDIFICILLLLVGAVFIYTPGDIAATQVFGFGGTPQEASTWIIYTVIFVYYLIATVFPIDKIIGRVYPIFGLILVFSAVGIFIAIFAKGYPLINVWDNWNTVGQFAADGGF